ncbi:ATP binding protein [Aureococcus anophagefferens]|nr:ATP binding protein [Aureococcus anophagefferens]
MRRLLAVALCASVADGLALRLPKLRHHRVDADAAEPAGADLRVHLLENDFEELDVALKAYGSCTQLVQGLMPIVGHEELVTRVVDRTHAEEPAPSLANAVPAQFEVEACLDLMAGEEWLAAHDVCAGYLERQKCEHEWTTATGILASICEAELEGGDYSKLDAPSCGASRTRRWPTATRAAAAAPPLAGRGRARRAEARLPDAVVVDEDDEEAAPEKTGLFGGRKSSPLVEEREDPASLTALDELVGLAPLKELCRGLVDAVSLDVERGDDLSERSFSAVFRGNPGTGKTVASKLYASLLGEIGATPLGKVVEVTGGGLLDDGVDGVDKLMKKFKDPQTSTVEVGDAVEVKRSGAWGHSGTVVYCDPKTGTYDVRGLNADGAEFVEIKAPRHQLRDPRQDGGTLLVDDAYQLDPSGSPVGKRVLQKLVAEMDAFPGTLAVVLCGYDKDMEQMLASSPGLRSRFRRDVAFEDFSDEELVEITRRRFDERFPKYAVADDKHLRIAARRLGKGRGTPGFGNARAAAQLLESASEKQSARVVAARKRGEEPDIFLFEREDLLGNRTLDHSESEPLRALRAMEGLWSVKSSVDELLELHASNVEREELELPLQHVALNRVFLGNPGTGKTTVAGLYGKILAEIGLLSVGDVVLATPPDFVGSALGQSEEKTQALLDRAKGCVLVIDEAYGLDPNGGHGDGLSGNGDPYKSSVIDAILENAFRFDDYDDQALLKIFLAAVKRRGRTISFADAKAAVRLKLAKQRLRPNFGNAGAVGNLVSEAGSPGTGKTTVARRMGMLFEALGVLPSADVVQVSASDLATGFVGQAAKKTRDVFDSARGAVLFVDEAYRLYDPTGRSYMQEAVDEIVTLLTEEDYKGKMVVIFAGYSGQMDTLLDKVNPGLKSRVSDVVSFPDFDAADAADVAELMLETKRLGLPKRSQLEAALQPLVDAPDWANGRDVENFVRRVAVECATRETTDVTVEALTAAAAFSLNMKTRSAPVVEEVESVEEPGGGAPDADDLAGDLDGALEEALVALGYDADDKRADLAKMLAAVAAGGAVPGDLVSYVVASRGGDAEAVAAALATQAGGVSRALQAQVTYDIALRTKADDDDDDDADRDDDALTEADILQRLRDLGPCPAGFSWHREGGGWRCGGGSHFVHDDDPLLLGE